VGISYSADRRLEYWSAGKPAGQLKKNPLLRALRIDKLTLVALEETLRLYLDERQALANIPTLKMLTCDVAELASRGKTIVRNMRRALSGTIALSLVDGYSQAGGGSTFAGFLQSSFPLQLRGSLPRSWRNS
jgi:L-seryl-tRNA(Ser) seleniumtransferase